MNELIKGLDQLSGGPNARFKLKVASPTAASNPNKYIWVLNALEAVAEPGWRICGFQYATNGDLVVALERE